VSVHEILEYAKDVGEKFGEEVVPANILPEAQKKLGMFILVNPFRIHETCTKAGLDWKEATHYFVLHEHLHDMFYKLYPDEWSEIEDLYRELIKIYAPDTTSPMLIASTFVDHYIDYIMLKELYPEYYDKHVGVLKKLAEWQYREIIPMVRPIIETKLPDIMFFFITTFAGACLRSGRVSTGRKFIKRNLKEYVWLYDEMVKLLKGIKSPDTLVKSFKKVVELAKKVIGVGV